MLIVVIAILKAFQLTAARRRLDVQIHIFGHDEAFQLTAARRRLATCPPLPSVFVSCFNSQPPEGGWLM